MSYHVDDFVINPLTPTALYIDPIQDDGLKRVRGLIPRDFSKYPNGKDGGVDFLGGDSPAQIKVYPRSEWPQRIKDQVADRRRLSDFRAIGNGGSIIPALDQNGKGYCWAHSTTGIAMLARAIAGQLYVPLSAYSVAATIKQGRDEGGWCGLSLKFVIERGIAPQSLWPQGDMNYNSPKYTSADAQAQFALYKAVESWYDLSKAEYDQTMQFDTVCSLLMSTQGVVGDFNWWGHSVALMDVVDGTAAARAGVRNPFSGKLMTAPELTVYFQLDHEVTGGYAIRILNSWGMGWGTDGAGVLTGSQAIPDNAVGIRAMAA